MRKRRKDQWVEECVKGYGSRVLSYLRRGTDCIEDAEDLTNETFLDVLRDSTIPAKDESYLFKLARNVLIDYGRTQHRRRKNFPKAIPGALDELNDTGESPLIQAERAETVALVRASVARLPLPLGAVVRAKEAGLTYEETADVLGCSKRTVERRLAKAYALLRADLKGLEPA